MSKDVIIMVKGNREAKVLPIDVEAMKEQGYEIWEPEVEDDVSTLKVAEIKELLNEKGIEYPEKAKKEELIALLEGAE